MALDAEDLKAVREAAAEAAREAVAALAPAGKGDGKAGGSGSGGAGGDGGKAAAGAGEGGDIAAQVEAAVRKVQAADKAKEVEAQREARLAELEKRVPERKPREYRRVTKFMGWLDDDDK